MATKYVEEHPLEVNDELQKDLRHVIDRLEAWAETHKGLAQRTWDGPEGTGHLNQAMNYQALANTLKRHVE